MAEGAADPPTFADRRATPLASRIWMVTQAEQRATATASVAPDEPVLTGHFPSFPIFPGVCLLECAHQTVLAAIDDPPADPASTTVLAAIERARFQQPVFPGDQLQIEAQLAPADDGTCARVTVATGADSGPAAATFRLAYRSQPTKAPAVDIKALLPHRYPMLLVDRVIEVIPGESLCAIKAVTVNEPCYADIDDQADHAYPPSLIVESWCQAAGILACLQHPNPDVVKGRVTLFGSITDLELPGRAYPGDLMRHTVRLARQVSDAAVLEGETTIDGEVVQRVGGITIALRPAEVLSRAADPEPVP